MSQIPSSWFEFHQISLGDRPGFEFDRSKTEWHRRSLYAACGWRRQGVYRITGVKRGDHVLTVHLLGTQVYSANVTIGKDELVHNIELIPEYTVSVIQGKVKDVQGYPVGGAEVLVGESQVFTEVDGTFSLAALFGEYDVKVIVSDFEVYEDTVEVDAKTVDLEIDLDRVHLGWDETAVTIGDVPDGWQVAVGDGTLGMAEEPISGQLALQFDASDQQARVFKMLDRSVTDRVILEFSAYSTDIRRTVTVSMANQTNPQSGPSSNVGPFVSVSTNGSLRFYTEVPEWGDGWINLGSVDIERWNHYRLDIDVQGQSFDVYVNGELFGTGRFRLDSVTSLNQIEVNKWQTNTIAEPVWVRDLRVIYP